MGFINSANGYIADVLSGKIPVGPYVRAACKRQQKDLARKRGFPYRFDVEAGERICRFIEKLPHTKGEWAATGETIKLEPWQCFILTTLFGWVKKSDGKRRFREAYVEVPRKNGKSIFAAGIGLYLFANDGEFGAEVYSGATTEKQAWEVFRPAKLMAERADGFAEHFGISVNAKTLSRLSDMSRFEPVIGKPGDGASPNCALIDEYHEHQTPDLYETMLTGMGARKQPMAIIITTAGSNVGGPCYAKRDDVIKVLQGTYDAPDIFGVIYSLDDTDDWTTEAALRKANPNYDVSVSGEFLISQQKKAMQSPALQNAFRTKHLNQWVSARTAFFNVLELTQCADEKLLEADFKGEDCFVGLDMASKIDITARVKLFRREDHYYAFGRFFIPEDTANDDANRMYWAWSNGGHLDLTPGSMIDYDYIEQDLRQCAADHIVKEVDYDPWNAAQLATRMENEGLLMVEYRATVQNFSEPMKQLQALMKAGKFHYADNPVFTWMFTNVVAVLDAKDNVYPRKEFDKNKIDGVIALLSALGRALGADDQGGSVYESRGVRVI